MLRLNKSNKPNKPSNSFTSYGIEIDFDDPISGSNPKSLINFNSDKEINSKISTQITNYPINGLYYAYLKDDIISSFLT
jgi:hypothetical protein